MRLLICGMHRSGHSVFAHLLCRATRMSLCDDPPWAQWSPRSVLNDAGIRCELELIDVLKCPRMAGYLDEVLASYSDLKVIWMHRDLRDILASILERTKKMPGSTLLKFEELGIEDIGIAALCAASRKYRHALARCSRKFDDRITIVKYEEFFRNKIGVIEHAAEWIGVPSNPAAIIASLDDQFGPTRHKFDGIRGPGRWRDDLDSVELAQLSDAAERWNAMFEDQKQKFQ